MSTPNGIYDGSFGSDTVFRTESQQEEYNEKETWERWLPFGPKDLNLDEFYKGKCSFQLAIFIFYISFGLRQINHRTLRFGREYSKESMNIKCFKGSIWSTVSLIHLWSRMVQKWRIMKMMIT